ncbi:MAG: hypothetical protein AcusKO_47990 [Acuticoccus sp.]
MQPAALPVQAIELPRPSIGSMSPQRLFDVALALAGLPLLALVAACLLALNPTCNSGPLFYRQRRMGWRGRPFTILKFRSMRPAPGLRAFGAPVEGHRTPPLGAFLRRHRIDELPQIINVLRGEMSIIGPRPDALEHAELCAAIVPGYVARTLVRPGITGLAQVTCGYAVGLMATAEKTRFDLHYIRNRSLRLDAMILWLTLSVVLRGGAGTSAGGERAAARG